MLGLIAAISVILIAFSIRVSQLAIIPLVVRPIPTAGWFAIGPLCFLYAQSLADSTFRLKKVHLMYFAFSIYNLLTIFFEVFDLPIGFYLIFKNIVVYSYVWLSMYLVHSIVFMIASIVLIRRSDSKRATFLLTFFYPFLIALLVYLGFVLIKSNDATYYGLIEHVLVLIFAVFVFSVGIISIRNSSHFNATSEAKKYFNSALSKGGWREHAE